MDGIKKIRKTTVWKDEKMMLRSETKEKEHFVKTTVKKKRKKKHSEK